MSGALRPKRSGSGGGRGSHSWLGRGKLCETGLISGFGVGKILVPTH